MQGLNIRQERFCLALFQPGKSAMQAYKDAGYKPANNNVAAVSAHHLLRNPNVQGRIEELKAEQASVATLSREEILQRVLDAHALAVERGQSAAALRALEMLGAELHGMFKGRTQVDMSSRMREMTDAELLAALERNLVLLGLPRPIADHSGGTSEPETADSENQNLGPHDP